VPIRSLSGLREQLGGRGVGGGLESFFKAIEDPDVVFQLPRRLPAPPPVTPVAPIRTAPIPLPRSIPGVKFLDRPLVNVREKQIRFPGFGGGPSEPFASLPVIIPTPRIPVPQMQQPCPPGFERR